MPEIRNRAATVYAVGRKVPKAEVRELFGVVEDIVTGAAIGQVGLKTWVQLAATTGLADKAVALVASTDLGQHTDPITSEMVDNAGYYSWNEAEAGWEWLFGKVTSPIIWMKQVSRTNNVPILEPAPGYTLPNNTGIGVTMAWRVESSPVAELGWSLGVDGITLDPLALKYRDATEVEPLRLNTGDVLYFTRNGTTGAYNALDIWDAGRAKPGAGAAPATIVMLNQVSREDNEVMLELAAGYTLPNDTGIGVIMAWWVDGAPEVGATWALGVDGITLDLLPFTYRDGTALETSRPKHGDLVFLTRNGVSGAYNVLDIWDAERGRPGSAVGGLTSYQRTISAWTNATARAALVLARRP